MTTNVDILFNQMPLSARNSTRDSERFSKADTAPIATERAGEPSKISENSHTNSSDRSDDQNNKSFSAHLNDHTSAHLNDHTIENDNSPEDEATSTPQNNSQAPDSTEQKKVSVPTGEQQANSAEESNKSSENGIDENEIDNLKIVEFNPPIIQANTSERTIDVRDTIINEKVPEKAILMANENSVINKLVVTTIVAPEVANTKNILEKPNSETLGQNIKAAIKTVKSTPETAATTPPETVVKATPETAVKATPETAIKVDNSVVIETGQNNVSPQATVAQNLASKNTVKQDDFAANIINENINKTAKPAITQNKEIPNKKVPNDTIAEETANPLELNIEQTLFGADIKTVLPKVHNPEEVTLFPVKAYETI